MLTDRQRALIMSYAEDEADVEGTVNGVTATATGEQTHTHTQDSEVGAFTVSPLCDRLLYCSVEVSYIKHNYKWTNLKSCWFALFFILIVTFSGKRSTGN